HHPPPTCTLFPYTTLFRSRETHLFLKQRVGADDHGRTVGDALQSAGAGLAFKLAGQPGDFNAERLQPFAEIDKVLFGENFGGCQDRKSTRLNSSHVKISYA